MDTLNFSKLLLKTAFTCMACDGDIDKREIQLIKQLHEEKNMFGEIDINEEVNNLSFAINKDGHRFFKDYFNDLTQSVLSEANELKLIEVAIDTIKADEKVEYSEVKFFKVIRSKLKIENEPILEKHPDFEAYLEQDIISQSYLSRLQDDFFDTQNLPDFVLINEIDIEALMRSKEGGVGDGKES